MCGRNYEDGSWAPLARGTRTIRMCSFDTRSEGAPDPPSFGEIFHSGWRGKVENERDRGCSMRAGKDSPCARLFRDNLRTSIERVMKLKMGSNLAFNPDVLKSCAG